MFLRGLIECRVYLIIWLLFGVCVVFFYLSLMWVFWCLMVRICGRNFTLIYAITWSCWAVRSFLLSSLVSTSFYIYHFYLVISHWNLDCCNSYCPNFEISEWNGPYAGKGPFSIFTFPRFQDLVCILRIFQNGPRSERITIPHVSIENWQPTC